MFYQPEGCRLGNIENRTYLSSLENLTEAMQKKIILEAPVVRCSENFDLTVELDGDTGTIFKEDVVLTKPDEAVKDIAVITRVGKPVCFVVKSVEKPKVGKPVIVLSRREAQQECLYRYLSKLRCGDVIDAKVTHLEKFGAFVDIGCGIIALLPIDALSVSRISHPRERLSVGMMMKVVVRSVERDGNGIPERIFVSRRELLGTWEENAALFSVGQTVTGIIRSIESYGIFVELTPNLAGLAEYREDVSVGQAVAVFIKSILPERMKCKLVIVDPCRSILPKRFDRLFENDATHIDKWTYSPEVCNRKLESVFSE